MAQNGDHRASSELHLAVIGGGIAGCAAASWAATHGARVTLFNAGLPLGGGCIHVGTFPARLLMSAATDHARALNPRFAGIHTGANRPDWSALNQLQRHRSSEIRNHYRKLFDDHPNVRLVDERATFDSTEMLSAGDEQFEPDRVLLTPGSHSLWPELDGLDDVEPLSLKSLGDLDDLPESVILWEVNDVALCYAQLLARLGSKVTVLTHKPRLLEELHCPDVDEAMTHLLTDEGIEIATDVSITGVESVDDGVRLLANDGDASTSWETDHFVIVDHRQPRIETLELDKAGVELTDQGFIVIDESLQTTNPNIFAAGDAIGRGRHAYASAYDATLAARNAIRPSRFAGHNTAVPFAIYTEPQLAGVGWNEDQARQAGFDADTATYHLKDLPAAQALDCRRGFIKLIRDRRSDHLVGARLIAPNASELVMELALAVRYGLTVSELAVLVHPAISLGQAISYAARQFADHRRPTSETSGLREPGE